MQLLGARCRADSTSDPATWTTRPQNIPQKLGRNSNKGLVKRSAKVLTMRISHRICLGGDMRGKLHRLLPHSEIGA